METKFKVGDKVRVNMDACPGGLQELTQYRGKKGKIKDLSKAPWVKFKNGDVWSFKEDDLELIAAKPSRHPFDLERALAGESLITRDGKYAMRFIRDHDLPEYPYSAVIEDDLLTFTESGRHISAIKSKFDLFMRHPAKNRVADGLDQVKEALNYILPATEVSDPVKDYDRLKDAFISLLNVLYERSGKGECPQWEGMIYWKQEAGLPV